MKKIKYFAFALSALLLTGCDDEDGFYNEKYVDVANLVSISTQPSYSVGEYIYVQADFSRYLEEPGQTTDLDIFTTTSGAPGFVFSYIIEKENGGVWTAVESTTNTLNIIDGTAQTGGFILATAVYDATDESYEYNIGFQLATAGNYRISFGVNSSSTNEIELRSKSPANKLFLNLISDTTQLNGGYYTFTVN
ncbi:MAG: hypothetical protein EOO50_06060 [Flavobacterium sp.]|uniref:hypothetical protein n=1 Tax=Flavobacterium sp. TaxID=239 RepID=UPI0012045200|nr:hypothetical protein [Flavobacterium sp.]RZJ67306.1 MAG: hypothetical protein EOO50_06060 [Flavobacterium sp.]